jgi:2-oxoisovalerate dehydrogenase E1 component
MKLASDTIKKKENIRQARERKEDKKQDKLFKAWKLLTTARVMHSLYEDKKEVIGRYVHATSKGHEAIQLAVSMQLTPSDYLSPYYRDDAMLLGIGYSPYELMLSLLAKKDDPFSGGRTYYSHPNSKHPDKPKIIHQSSATGMQAIPATGLAHGLQYLKQQRLKNHNSIVVCSLGDASLTEGEVSEAFQMAVLKKLQILYVVQDNEWDISAHSSEIRAMNASEYARGFKGMNVRKVNGSNFLECYQVVRDILNRIRSGEGPYLLHANVPLLSHHTSGVRKEWYRPDDDLLEHASRDPYPILHRQLIENGYHEAYLGEVSSGIKKQLQNDFNCAIQASEPDPSSLHRNVFVPSPITEEQGIREPENGKPVLMVDAALHAVDEILSKHPEALLYGQDVGGRLGGVFREAATLAQRHGNQRVFNTPIQEAYIIGSTAGMSAAGCKPIVEIQFADYIWPGLNQLFTELSRSCYLSEGKWPVQSLIRVPTGAYGGGGPYHSSSLESVILQIKGIKVVYPSNAADMKGLMKAAFYDPNPVIMFEHKGLYWSKIPGTQEARTIEPGNDYMIPLGKARLVLKADETKVMNGDSVVVITYGMGVYWAKTASRKFPGKVSILDLRTLNPLDEEAIYAAVKKHHKALVVTEETLMNSFAEALSGRIASECFQWLDAPVKTIGSENLPAIPVNIALEKAMLPSAEKISETIVELLHY